MSGMPPPNKSRLPLYLGLGVAAIGGYYLYSAGDPKLARKEIEHDAARASSAVRSEIPGRDKEAMGAGVEWGQKAGSKVDSAVDDARVKANTAGSKADQYRKDGERDLQQKIDQVDRKVEEGVSRAKSGVSSWFGSK
ncbi:MAG: hypothetical protein M1840_004390 [Geoglossum simile]|nr:MAG: hypothetical protein M1840_004390 [Geoglossum simile]